MARSDLLALSPDDLAALANRGTVKRAQREIDENECTGALAEADDGTVTARWSDGIECVLPAGAVLAEGRCSCPATGVCRHLIRTVLAYQRQIAPADSAAPAAAVPVGPWDPGSITDDELAAHYRAAALTKLREQFAQGVLVELVRGSKPSARLHQQGCVVRFLVPGDPRYTHCDCAEPAPCSHVPLAVWSFRLLPAEQAAGVLATGQKAPPPPAGLLDDLEAALLEVTEFGVSGAPATWAARLAQLEEACRQADLVWPAEVLAELAQQRERYTSHDARFAPERLADAAGELLIRVDAIRRDTGALPQALIRGSRGDRPAAIGAARFIGLGCGVRVGRRSVELTAYLQDSDTGSVVVVRKEFAEGDFDPAKPPRSFGDLAQASAVKGCSFASLGAGQLLIRGAKRSPEFHLQPGRADATVQPQAFAWEGLRPPVLVEDFAELDARLGALPPAALRPRRAGEDFHVCPVASVEAAHFDLPTQTVRAVLADARGQRAVLEHPFTARGAVGAEALLAALAQRPADLRFVAGPVRRGPAGLVVHPICVVWQDGDHRTALQPWVERHGGSAGIDLHGVTAEVNDPLGDHLRQLQTGLGELLVIGLQRVDTGLARRWQEYRRQGEAIGLVRLAERVAVLAEALEAKAHTLHWDWRPAGSALLELAILVRLAHDLMGE